MSVPLVHPPDQQRQDQPDSHHTSIPASAMPLLSPSALLHAHLSQSPNPTRPSGRNPTQPRPISLNTSSLTHADGSSLIRIGDTAVVCGVRAEILSVAEIANYRVRNTTVKTTSTLDDGAGDGEGYEEITENNLLVPNIELNTGCSSAHMPGGPPSVEAQTLSQRLLSTLHVSRIVDPAELKIYYTPPPDANSGEQERELKAYWTLYIDILCISHAGSGSVFDAAWLAAYAALSDVILPRAWWDADEGGVRCSPERKEARKLNLRGAPVPTSFGVFVASTNIDHGKGQKTEKWVLYDLDTLEEECCDEVGCVVVECSGTGPGDIIKLEKAGGTALGIHEMSEIVQVAKVRWKEWQGILKGG